MIQSNIDLTKDQSIYGFNLSRSEMSINPNDELTEIDECCYDDERSFSRKHSFNQKTQKILSNLSKFGQSIVQSTSRQKKVEPIKEKRPKSMYILNQSIEPFNLDQYMHDSTLVMALRETENKLLESETARSRMESKIETLENEVSCLRNENDQYVGRERNLLHQIQELDRKYQSKVAEAQEYSLNARIKEIELLSEITTMTQKLTSIDTERQERKIQKIMDCQNRIMEQTLPYTASVENIYDTEDGLFNAGLFGEILKGHSQSLDKVNSFRKLSSPKTEDEDNYQNMFLKDPMIKSPDID